MNEEIQGAHCPPPPLRREFPFIVDAEKLVAYSEGDTAELSVRTILDMAGNQPPEDYYLIAFEPERKKHEALDEVLLVKPHAKFAAIFKGCTPVS